ncbi:hypothetical protein ACFV1F_07820, partial [Streptomyces sp. NPDC059590]|uniref:hypothetical protein n=1 Tax=Streptomyces sp. NPDC059590 TaxID=3346877 RepID=UPI0036AF2BD7
MLDVVGAEPGNPCQRLRVEEDERGTHTALEWDVVVVDKLCGGWGGPGGRWGPRRRAPHTR